MRKSTFHVVEMYYATDESVMQVSDVAGNLKIRFNVSVFFTAFS